MCPGWNRPSPTTKARTGGALPRLILAAALALGPGGALAQSQGWGGAPAVADPARPLDDAGILALVEAGDALLRAGDPGAALPLLERANDSAYGRDDLGLTALHLPNLALARWYLTAGDWDEVGRFAASVATGLDVEGYRDHPMRIEAMAFQGAVAQVAGRLNEADLILRAVLAASEGRPETARARDLAQFHLAATAYQLGAADATAIRRAYLDAPPVDGSWIGIDELAFIYYLEIFASRAEGEDPAALAQLFRGVLDGLTGPRAIAPEKMSLYRGFLGLLLSEAGDPDAALAAFEDRHAFLIEAGLFDDDFLFNAQRLAMTRHNLGDTAGAYRALAEAMDLAQARGLVSGVYAVLHEDLGQYQQALGDPDLAQAHYRRAYALLREGRARTDPEVLRLAPRIDTAAPDFAGFAFADELRRHADAPPTLDDDGGGVLAAFFRGGYLDLDDQLFQLGRDGADAAPAYRLNRALFLGLMGYQDGALVDIAALRDAVAPDSPLADMADMADLADLAEGVARVWGAEADVPAADPALARLLARGDALAPGPRSAALALAAFQSYRLEQLARTRALIDGWLALPPPPRGDIWHLFAHAMIVEIALGLVEPAKARAIWQGLQDALAAAPDLTLLRDYARSSYLAKAPDALADPDAVVELGALLRRLRVALPPHHATIALTEFTLSNALRWRGQTEQALVWLDRAATSLRQHPSLNPDTLAYLLSEQAPLLIDLGRTDQAALIAREAYDMVDPRTGRAGVLGGVVTNLAQALQSRTGRAQAAAEVYDRHLNDPVYLARMPPLVLANQWLSHAEALGETGTWDDVARALDWAEASLDSVADLQTPHLRARLGWSRAIADWRFDRPGLGFAAMRDSNAALAAYAAELRSARGDEVSLAPELQARAAWTALIGWDYAQSLPE